ncbi:hypothetical protein QCA50_014185 [Cerrena zonata]|uniref:Uncharacterized protein n=1 Tax=Cerrena zonata TaxID=2478898 RepID=A0AAW0FZN7_9APHY
MTKTQDSFMFTVGKLDAGMAILLGERAHLIEFPSLLLPPGATTGSIVNISVTRNVTEEKKRDNDFWDLQNDILTNYGVKTPQPPKLEVRNVTQTSVTLEWPKLDLATAKLRSLDIYRNHQRLAAIPSPLTNTSTKLSGLAIDTEYRFHLVMRTTAGTFQSNVLNVRTHTMADTSGISVCFGNVQDNHLLENARLALGEMGAKWSDKIQIDTTHFVCTTPAATPGSASTTGSMSSAPGVEYQKALQLSIPVVNPNWILACHSEKKMVPIHPYYLGASSSTPMSSAPFSRPQSMSQVTLPSPSSRSPVQNKAANRQSMPAQRSTPGSPPASSFVNQTHQPIKPIEPTPEEESEDDSGPQSIEERFEETDEEAERAGRPRKAPPPPVPALPPSISVSSSQTPPPKEPKEDSRPSPPQIQTRPTHTSTDTEDASLSAVPNIITPSTVEVPPPPPVEKERSPMVNDVGDDDLGETEEISLS